MVQRSRGEKMFMLSLSMIVTVILTFGISKNIILILSPPKNALLLSFYILPIILASNYYGLTGGIVSATLSTIFAVTLAKSSGIMVEDVQVTAQIILYFLVGCFGGIMQSQNIRIQKALHVASITDELTGLCNYQHFRRRLDEEIKRARRYGHPLALLMCDVDNFKQYNDAFGHPNGNFVLNKIATLIRDSIRESDIPFRYGGDEFAILLPETRRAEAGRVAERVAAVVDAGFASTTIDPGLRPGLSIGVACSTPGGPLPSTDLISIADNSLYEAKRSGKKTLAMTPESDRVS